MEQYSVTGMSCAACSARVEKAVAKVPGVTSCSVSLLTNSMGVEGSAASSDIIAAVEEAGYEAAPKVSGDKSGASAKAPAENDLLKDRETPILKKRLIASLCFLVPLMYVSMGHMMWNWPVPEVLDGNHVAMGLIQLLFTTVIMVVNQKFFISGFRSLWHRAPNMDTLVALGAGASYIYSTYALFAMTDAQMHGDMAGVMNYMHEFYFESAAMILTLITVGKMLEARSKGRTTDALKSLMKLAPKTATVLRGEIESVVSIEQVVKGDIFVVRPGENIPVDGIIIEAVSYTHLDVYKRQADTSVQSELLNEVSALLVETKTNLKTLIKVTEEAAEKEEGAVQANFYHSDVFPAMENLRKPVDALEMIVDKDVWPMPSYGDLIFEV